MKESVAEFIQTKCIDDLGFARLTMHPRKSMIHCFQYISRKAWDYVQDELKANGVQPGPGQQAYGCDIPDGLLLSVGRRTISVTPMPRRIKGMKGVLSRSLSWENIFQSVSQEEKGRKEEKRAGEEGTAEKSGSRRWADLNWETSPPLGRPPDVRL